MPDVTITLKTIDDSTPKVAKVKKEYEGMVPALEKATRGVGDFISKNAALIGVVAGTAAALGKAYGEWQKYAQEVRDVSLASGATAEEASRLLQVLDDYQISAQDVTAATRAMTKEGLVPSMETLAQLSDEYLSITDVQQRNEFVIKNLGRAGLQWTNVLSQGSDALREQSKEVSKNLILNDEMIKKAEKERLAMDALADTWQGFKVQVGAAVGEMILANDTGQRQIDMLRDLDKISGKQSQNYRFLTDDQKAMIAQLERGAAMTEFYKTRVQEVSEVIESEAVPSFTDLLSLTEDIGRETQDYNTAQDELKTKQTEIKKQIDVLIKQGWSPMSQKVKDLQKEYNQLGVDSKELAAEHSQAMKQIQYDLLITKLSTDGLTSAEYDLAISVGESLGIFSRESAKAAKAMNQLTEHIAAGKIKANQLDQALRLMEEHQYNIDVVLDIISQYAGGPSGGQPIGQEGPAVPVWGGGQLSKGWSLVGDRPGGGLTPWSELISPSGYVFDAKTTRKLMESGMISGVSSRALAGELDGGIARGTNLTPPPVVMNTNNRSRGGGGGSGSSSGTVSTGGIADLPASEIIMQTNQVVEESRALQIEVRQQVQQAITASSRVISSKMDEMIGVLLAENPRQIGKQVAFEFAKSS